LIPIHQALKICDSRIEHALHSAGVGFNAVTSHLSQAKGKGIRALLLLTAAANFPQTDSQTISAASPNISYAEGVVSENAILAAAAVEILHMATLVHDDVMDDAPTRRGMPSVHRKFDVKTAVICGDYLLSVSLCLLADMDKNILKRNAQHESLAPKFSRALSAICKGEYLQHINNGNLDMTLNTYLRIIGGKTAALFYISAYAGAALCETSNDEASDIGRFGRMLGMLFQIADDCKDYAWTESMAKKPVANDIRAKVVTLPLIFAMQRDAHLRAVAQEVMAGTKDSAAFADILRKTHALEDTHAVFDRYEKWAANALRNVSEAKRNALLEILSLVQKI